MRNTVLHTRTKYYRGEVYYIYKSPSYSVGSEMYGARPGIIVSNDVNNEHSDVVEVVYLTTTPKADLPTHAKVAHGVRQKSIALCEQVVSVAKSRIGDYYGKVSDMEQAEIDKALKVSLGLDDKKEPEVKVETKLVVDDTELKAMTMERDMYKRMYDDLMNKIMNK